MPNRNLPARVQQILKRNQEWRATRATIHAVDGDRADIILGSSSTVVRYVEVAGDPEALQVGDVVSIRWEEKPGSYGPRPVVISPAGGEGTSSPRVLANVIPDNVTLENSSLGLRVKVGGVGIQHLNFTPAVDGHVHEDSFQAAGWQVDSAGVIFNGDTRIHPNGMLSLGTGNNLIKLDSSHATYRLWVGHINPATAPFSVERTGTVKAVAGTIGGWTMSATTLQGNNLILDSAGNIRTSNFVSGATGWRVSDAGNAEFNDVHVRGALHSTVFTYNELHANAGMLGVFKSAGKLLNDFTSVTSPTTFNVDIEDPETGHVQLFAVSDILRVKDGSGNDVWMTVQSVSDQTTFYRYTCVKNSGSNATFRAGAAVVDYGPSGQGFLVMDAVSASTPYYDVRTHAGAPWTTQTVKARLGNLAGVSDPELTPTGYGLYANNVFLTGEFISTYAKIKSTGIEIPVSTSPSANRAYRFTDAGVVTGTLKSYKDAIFNTLELATERITGRDSLVSVNSYAAGGGDTSSINLSSQCQVAGPVASLSLFSDATDPTYTSTAELTAARINLSGGTIIQASSSLVIGVGGLHVGGYSDPGNDNLQVDGTANVTGLLQTADRLRAGDGSSSFPSHSFMSDTNTGAYRIGENQYGIATGGGFRFRVEDAGFTSYLPWVLYSATEKGWTAADYLYACCVQAGITPTVTRWEQCLYVQSPNGASDYWVLELRDEDLVALGPAVNTQNNAVATWVRETWTGTYSLSGSTILYVYARKVGSPGALYTGGPIMIAR